MSRKKPPEELVKLAIELLDVSDNLDNWQYRRICRGHPGVLQCMHEGEPFFVGINAFNDKKLDSVYGVGECEICGKVIWCEIEE